MELRACRQMASTVYDLSTDVSHSAAVCVSLQMFSIRLCLKQREHMLNVSKLLIEHYRNTFNHLMIKPLFLLAVYFFPPQVWQRMYKCWQKLALHTPLCKLSMKSLQSPVFYPLESASLNTHCIVYVLHSTFYGQDSRFLFSLQWVQRMLLVFSSKQPIVLYL